MENIRLDKEIRNSYVRGRFKEEFRQTVAERGTVVIHNMVIGAGLDYIGQKREMKADVTYTRSGDTVSISSSNHHLETEGRDTRILNMDSVTSLLGIDVAAANEKRLMFSLERGVMIPVANSNSLVFLRLRRSHGLLYATGIRYKGKPPGYNAKDSARPSQMESDR